MPPAGAYSGLCCPYRSPAASPGSASRYEASATTRIRICARTCFSWWRVRGQGKAVEPREMEAMSEPEFEDIPGTLLFDAERSRKGYHLNMFCMSLMKPENRDAFRADEAGYLKQFPMTPEQVQSILKRD